MKRQIRIIAISYIYVVRVCVCSACLCLCVAGICSRWSEDVVLCYEKDWYVGFRRMAPEISRCKVRFRNWAHEYQI